MGQVVTFFNTKQAILVKVVEQQIKMERINELEQLVRAGEIQIEVIREAGKEPDGFGPDVANELIKEMLVSLAPLYIELRKLRK